jgi:UDPglucose 6-dehydrogenase
MKISVIGTGYVGLPTGIGFAELGHEVTCIDKLPEKIEVLKAGKITLYEDGLEELFRRNFAAGSIQFTTSMTEGVVDAAFIIIAVGTPQHPETREADLKYIYAAAAELAPNLTHYTVIAIKSTVPIGTGDSVESLICDLNPNAEFDVISMPEFLREGFAVYDFFHPDRVVAGTNSGRAKAMVEELYSVFPERPNILFVRRRSAEIIKYASNAFLAIKLHYINEMADLCRVSGADIYEVAKGIGLDSRIGPKFLNPGPGYGGSCFPKDTHALAYMARQVHVDLTIVDTVIMGNDKIKKKMATRIIDAVYNIENPRIAVWGLAFKGGTDDVRESPAIQIISHLIACGKTVTAFDPKANANAYHILGDQIAYAVSAEEAAEGADILAVLTEWEDFRRVDFSTIRMRTRCIIDLRNVIDKEAAIRNGFEYQGLGLEGERSPF